ncbi:5'-3' exoribonuclease [Quillaja saponaria]|uniref:5'-3' exoribonuclease n=1 Tax=Quillaja saponaria TaxID=32244 RepID=A0AAD7VML4_QUISA|nr:5'-3' exoribonuclease [Quillaja saponaria]
MGVPSFYRWLTNKYPKVVEKAIEQKGDCLDTSMPNPNGMEFDNLYLDMNGIIHPCFHPDVDHPAFTPPITFEEVFSNIFAYIDRLFGIVRPRKLLYMAIDGVAPRAKMNQQRSRRFKSARDNEIAEAEEERLRRQFELEGKQVLLKKESEISDSNIVTPGTKFMFELSKALQSYISSRMTSDGAWKDLKVILSDANVPGEGEHKIMSFVRQQRSLPDYDPNTRHVLYGLDADLLMLALATHEIHFSILREDVQIIQDKQPVCQLAIETSLSGALSSTSIKPSGWLKNVNAVTKSAFLFRRPFEFLHIWILREYLELDMKIQDPPENLKIDFERIIDDFIFMCSFAGNDFLPHMPTLEIHEGSIDLLMTVYKKEFKKFGGYLVDMNMVSEKRAAYVKLSRVERFIHLVGTYEEKIFKKRSEIRDRRLKRIIAEHEASKEEENEFYNSQFEEDGSVIFDGKAPSSDQTELQILENTKELKEKLKDHLKKKCDTSKNGDFGADKIKLGTIGWKQRYYKEKFSVESPSDVEAKRKEIVQKYTEGLVWVILYYFSGVPSWTWFYPYHYGPFASDLKGLGQVRVAFQRGVPFKPFDQLLGVLPPRSAHALPEAYAKLMVDEESNIIEFYPPDLEVDMDGKQYLWQGICKLPFIEEGRLLAETRRLEKELLDEDAKRNSVKVDYLFLRSTNISEEKILSLSARPNEHVRLDSVSDGIGGSIRLCRKDVGNVNTEVQSKDCLLCVSYELPATGIQVPRVLSGVKFPLKTILETDINETRLWHEYQRNVPVQRLQIHGTSGTSSSSGGTSSHWSTIATYEGGCSSSISSNSSSQVLHRDAGTGWAGRGRASFSHSIGQSSQASELHHFNELKIRETNQVYRPYERAQLVDQSGIGHNQVYVHYGRGQLANGAAGSSRNWSADQTNSASLPGSLQSEADHYNLGRGRWFQGSNYNGMGTWRQSSSNSSFQVQGRGRSAPQRENRSHW